MFEHFEKHVINDCDEYRAALDEFRNEQGEQLLLIHFRFRKRTKSAFQKLLHDWRVFRECVPSPIFAYYPEDGPPDKWERFVTKLGFQEVKDVAIPHPKGDQRIFVSFK